MSRGEVPVPDPEIFRGFLLDWPGGFAQDVTAVRGPNDRHPAGSAGRRSTRIVERVYAAVHDESGRSGGAGRRRCRGDRPAPRVVRSLKDELGRVIVGQHDVIERLAICLFARGHALLMGVPGLAKTLLVAKLAETMS